MSPRRLPRRLPRHLPRTLLASALLLATGHAVAGPWIAAPGQGSLALGFDWQSGNTYFVGTQAVSLPGDLSYQTLTLDATYGVTRWLALDASVGTQRRTFEPQRPQLVASSSESAATDPKIGLNLLLLDEFAHDGAPSIGLRVGAIFTGGADADAFGSTAVGSNAIDLSLAIGKYVTRDFSLAARVGMIQRARDFPREVTYSLSASVAVTLEITLSAGIDALRSEGENSITFRQASAEGFARRSVDEDSWNVGASFALSRQVSLDLTYSAVNGGRNTLKGDTFSAALAYSF